MTLPLVGAKVKAADLASVFPTNTDAWSTYVPTWTQSATISKTINMANYMKVGRKVTCCVHMSATSAGTAANRMVVSLPIAAASGLVRTIGAFRFSRSGTGYYLGSVTLLDTTHVIFASGSPTAEWLGATGAAFTGAIAATDAIDFTVEYEAAS